MQSSDSIVELATALNAAQAELENVDKDANNPAFKSKYASLAGILNMVRPTFAKHGLSFIQSPAYAAEQGLAIIETTILHKSGQFVTSALAVPVTKKDAQGLGSAITYGRRYALSAIAGISQEDDDGNAAAARPRKAKDEEAGSPDIARTISEHTDGEKLRAFMRALSPDDRTRWGELAQKRLATLEKPKGAE